VYDRNFFLFYHRVFWRSLHKHRSKQSLLSHSNRFKDDQPLPSFPASPELCNLTVLQYERSPSLERAASEFDISWQSFLVHKPLTSYAFVKIATNTITTPHYHGRSSTKLCLSLVRAVERLDTLTTLSLLSGGFPPLNSPSWTKLDMH
jgi:hypothetical protein